MLNLGVGVKRQLRCILESHCEDLYEDGMDLQNGLTTTAIKESDFNSLILEILKLSDLHPSIFNCDQNVHQIDDSGKCINCGVEFLRVNRGSDEK